MWLEVRAAAERGEGRLTHPPSRHVRGALDAVEKLRSDRAQLPVACDHRGDLLVLVEEDELRPQAMLDQLAVARVVGASDLVPPLCTRLGARGLAHAYHLLPNLVKVLD